MHPQLSHDRSAFPNILHETLTVAADYLTAQDDYAPGRHVENIILTDLPEQGIGAQATVRLFREKFASQIAASAGPRYFGFVTGGSTPAAVAGDWLVSAYDQNACGSNDSIAPQLEKQALHFLKQLLGIDAAYFGSFVTGATMSNFVGLAQARQWVGLQHGLDFSNDGIGAVPVRVVSATPHSSVIKSLAMLGVGRNAMIRPATLPDREAVDVGALEQTLADLAQPAIVVANAGTVNTVDFDDLEAIVRLKRKYSFWLHVDAAFGGFAGASEKYAHLMRGISGADSITVDAHKWLNVPYDAAMQFTRHRDIQLQVFQNSAAYLGDPDRSPDNFHYTPENSRRWRGLPSWFTLIAYGKSGHREIVERNCALAFRLGEGIRLSTGFRLLAPVRMNVVCFTIDGGEVTMAMIQDLLSLVRDEGTVFFTPTVYKGVPAIRAAISNWQTSEHDVDAAVSVLNAMRSRQRPVVA